MTMKMINKADCEYKGGYIVCNGEIVCIDNEIVDLFNKLEEDVQRATFEANKQPVVAVFNEEFARKTEHGKIMPFVKASTPELDNVVDKTMKIMDELDACASAELANEYFAGIKPLIMFVNDEFIVSGEQATQHRFDLPTIGNPLNISKDDLADWVIGLFE